MKILYIKLKDISALSLDTEGDLMVHLNSGQCLVTSKDETDLDLLSKVLQDPDERVYYPLIPIEDKEPF